MKKISFLFLIPYLSFAQVPEEGDYVMTTWASHPTMHYVFKESRNVFFGHNPATRKTEVVMQSSKELVTDLFRYVKSIDFSKVKGLDENNLPKLEGTNFRIIEYRAAGKVYRVCFDEDGGSVEYESLRMAVSKLNGFW